MIPKDGSPAKQSLQPPKAPGPQLSKVPAVGEKASSQARGEAQQPALSPKLTEDVQGTEKDRKSAKKKLNMNRVMVTKVYDLMNCQCSEDMDTMTLTGLPMPAAGRQGKAALKSKNYDPNAITDLHVKEVPNMTTAVFLGDESTGPAHLSTATPRTKEAAAKRREARKKTLKALKTILENKNLRSLAREVSGNSVNDSLLFQTEIRYFHESLPR